MLRAVLTWSLKLSVFSLEVENYHIPFPKSKDMNFSALSDRYFSAPEKNGHFLYGPWGHLEAGAICFLMEKRLKHSIQSWHEPWGRKQKEEMCFSYFKEAEKAFQYLDIF